VLILTRNNSFSGFDLFNVDDELKARVQVNILSGTANKISRRKRLCHIAIVSLPTAAVIAFFVIQLSGGIPIVSTSNYAIVSRLPFMLFSNQNNSYSVAKAPTEKEFYSLSDNIIFGKITDFKWVIPHNRTETDPIAYTIVTVSVEKSYRGDLTAGQSEDILLPYFINGTGSTSNGYFTEDTDTAVLLKKGLHSFFFFHKYSNSDTLELSGNNIPATQMAKYGVRWGTEYVVPETAKGYLYSFDNNGNNVYGQELPLKDVETAIERNLNNQS
jgi:hypothetical protein